MQSIPSNFTWPIRVYYEDTDASGVAYHGSFLRWFERARSEWLRARGVDHQQLLQQFGCACTLANISVDYKSPARLDEALVVTVELQQARAASLIFSQKVLLADQSRVLAVCSARIACVDAQKFMPTPWPLAWLALLKQ